MAAPLILHHQGHLFALEKWQKRRGHALAAIGGANEHGADFFAGLEVGHVQVRGQLHAVAQGQHHGLFLQGVGRGGAQQKRQKGDGK